MRVIQSRLLVGIAALVASSGSACRHHTDFREQYAQMRVAMANGDWTTASQQLENSKTTVYTEDDQVMYWLNLGTLLHYAGNPTKSNDNFVKAENRMQELWTTSISTEATKYIVSETVQPYEGEDFEKVLLYLYTSINNVNLNKLQDAVVEARRADELLKKMLVHYEKEGEIGTLYKQDAFMLWLVGLYYELQGRSGLSDAHLAYKAAYKSYREDYSGNYGISPPRYLGEDLVRTAKLLGNTEDAERFAGELGATGETMDRLNARMSELILVHANGEAPHKEEFFIDAPMPDLYIVRIALPKFVASPTSIQYAEVEVNGATARTELAEPLTQMVLKNFEHRLPAITARAIARATLKYAATKGTEAAVSGGDDASAGRKLAGALLGIAGNVAAAVSEAADLRSWTTLPGSIGVARLWLPSGHNTLQVTYHNASGSTVGRMEQITLDLKPGERRIISVRTIQ